MPERWYIWYKVFSNGVQIGKGRYYRSYRHKNGAERRARQMWGKPLHNSLTDTTIKYLWVISEDCPWED